MRIFSDCRELMSELGRELNSYGIIVKPKHYQNKNIEGDSNFFTKELICQTYCLTSLDKYEYLFAYTHDLDWAIEEFKERVSGYDLNPGKAWLLRDDVWRQFLNKSGRFDYTYPERINRSTVEGCKKRTNLNAIIDLLRDDQDTRKAVLSIYEPCLDAEHYFGDERIPCSMYYDFLIRDSGNGKQLNITYHQRSSDFVCHFGNDVYLAFKLMEYVADKVDVKPGYLFHTVDSLHAYQKDWPMLSSNIDDIVIF